jgi:hypothetical protein
MAYAAITLIGLNHLWGSALCHLRTATQHSVRRFPIANPIGFAGMRRHTGAAIRI